MLVFSHVAGRANMDLKPVVNLLKQAEKACDRGLMKVKGTKIEKKVCKQLKGLNQKHLVKRSHRK